MERATIGGIEPLSIMQSVGLARVLVLWHSCHPVLESTAYTSSPLFCHSCLIFDGFFSPDCSAGFDGAASAFSPTPLLWLPLPLGMPDLGFSSSPSGPDAPLRVSCSLTSSRSCPAASGRSSLVWSAMAKLQPRVQLWSKVDSGRDRNLVLQSSTTAKTSIENSKRCQWKRRSPKAVDASTRYTTRSGPKVKFSQSSIENLRTKIRDSNIIREKVRPLG